MFGEFLYFIVSFFNNKLFNVTLENGAIGGFLTNRIENSAESNRPPRASPVLQPRGTIV